MRLETVHAALAHFTLGGLPLVVIAYAMAARRRSVAWTFAGDAALVLTAALTLATGAFGLVSDAVVPWPGGLEGWRALHLGLGVATTALLAVLAAWRLARRRRRAPVRVGTLAAALVVGGVAGATGLIGGEVLVFHAGMAVRAAGDGALAPPVGGPAAPPGEFLPAMREARAAWAGIQARLAWMLVQQPRDADFAAVEDYARRLQAAAAAMAEAGGRDGRHGALLASMSQALGGDAADIEEAARARSLQDIARAAGEASAHCADCHAEARWPTWVSSASRR